MLWPGHPLGRDIGGTRESVGGITREMILDFVSAYYTPGQHSCERGGECFA